MSLKPTTSRASVRACGGLLLLLLAAAPAELSSQTNPGTQPRQFAAVAHDPASRQFLLFGGTYGKQRFNDTWLLGASGWKSLTTSTRPAERIAAAATFDSARQEFVLFGGRVNNAKPALCSPAAPPKGLAKESFCSDTWVFTGRNWIRMTPAVAPSARDLHAMAFDPVTRQVVLFGGVSATTAAPLNDTWVWNGSTWRKLITAHNPAPRFWHTMAYDPVHRQIVMFGGNGGKKILNDTWLWNGWDWLPAPPQATPPQYRTGAALDYSAALGKMVLFSGTVWDGVRVGKPSQDAWTWDGGQWKALPDRSFALFTDFSRLPAKQAASAILANGTPSMLWVPR